jgi:hypothetical protein
MTSRRCGKTSAEKLALEAALNAGKRVCVVTPNGMTLQRRKKHLTLIETIPRQGSNQDYRR